MCLEDMFSRYKFGLFGPAFDAIINQWQEECDCTVIVNLHEYLTVTDIAQHSLSLWGTEEKISGC